ncbi:hypothetical protein Zmor_002698 [Zophobas morio]|uniref:Uncharacterized protein n=1 Tax=Zophobas morio TaxID=2755281 RepID=A0AA38M0J5_9CUCU|nr:hypothetical protein Zmor_002698 [Zophobas morio]
MHISSLTTSVFIWWVWFGSTAAFALPRTKEYRGSSEVVSGKNGVAGEPSCEELKAMWRFSKRQSRAAEITNEIPMYRDPFSDNVWEPYYATSRSMGGMRMGGKSKGRPVFGRVYYKAPLRIQDLAERNRAFEEVAKMYGTVQRQTEPRRRITAFRLSGGGHLPSLGLTPQSGSFQHLKELIRTERARELQEQRMAEEVAARAAALKELAGSHRSQANYRDINYNYDIDGREDQRESYMGRGGLLGFPDLLVPSSRQDPDDTRFIQDYGYSRDRPRAQSSSLFDTSSFNVDDFDGLML